MPSTNKHLSKAREVLEKCGVGISDDEGDNAIGGTAFAVREILLYLEEQEKERQGREATEAQPRSTGVPQFPRKQAGRNEITEPPKP